MALMENATNMFWIYVYETNILDIAARLQLKMYHRWSRQLDLRGPLMHIKPVNYCQYLVEKEWVQPHRMRQAWAGLNGS